MRYQVQVQDTGRADGHARGQSRPVPALAPNTPPLAAALLCHYPQCSAPTRKSSHAPNPTNHVPTPPGKQVLKEEMSADPLYLRGGATIPALALFQKHLGADTAVFGFGLPDGGAHAPNEHLPEGMYHLAQRAYVKLYHALAAKPGDGAGADRSEL